MVLEDSFKQLCLILFGKVNDSQRLSFCAIFDLTSSMIDHLPQEVITFEQFSPVTHALNDGLVGLLISAVAERWILSSQLVQGFTQLVRILLGGWLAADLDHRLTIRKPSANHHLWAVFLVVSSCFISPSLG